MYETPDDQLTRALIPGASTERFGRTWRLGRTSRLRDNVIFARVGFSRESGAESWDEVSKDFVDVIVPSGLAAPFTVDLDTLHLAFQIRPPDIKTTSFTGALQHILREATGNDEWIVEVPRHEATFEHWVSTVRAITEIRLRLTPPNPNYIGRPHIQTMLELMNADAATLTLASHDGLNMDALDDADVINQAITHINMHYGNIKAVGIDKKTGRKSKFDSKRGDAQQFVEGIVDPLTGEVSEGALLDRMSDPRGD